MRSLIQFPNSMFFTLILAASFSFAAQASDTSPELLPLPEPKYSLAGTNFAKRTAWLGLYCKGKVCELKKVNLLASQTTVPAYEQGKVAGQVLKIEDGSRPICLFRGFPNNKPRKLTTFYRAAKDKQVVKTNLAFEIKGEDKTPYRVVVTRSHDKMTYSLQHGALKQNMQVLDVDGIVGDDGLPKRDEIVLWAGDFDGDGKADFLTALTNRSGEALVMQLYLSKGAGKGKIVKPPIQFDYWPPDNPGC